MNDGKRRELTIQIEATPEDVWRAITDPELTRGYYYGTEIISTWQPGEPWKSVSGDELYLVGDLLEVEPARRLVQSFRVAIEEPAASDPPSTVTWQLASDGNGTRLTLTHEGLAPATYEYTEGGWEHILGGMKNLLETGQPLAIGGMEK
jgi:uncharacterized protein YndB with AHSA1/START domain